MPLLKVPKLGSANISCRWVGAVCRLDRSTVEAGIGAMGAPTGTKELPAAMEASIVMVLGVCVFGLGPPFGASALMTVGRRSKSDGPRGPARSTVRPKEKKRDEVDGTRTVTDETHFNFQRASHRHAHTSIVLTAVPRPS